MDGKRQIGSQPLKPRLYDKSWVVSEVADFNGDGHPDILLQHPTNGTFYLWYMDNTVQIGSEPLRQKLSDKAWRTVGESYWSIGGWEAGEEMAAMAAQGEELGAAAIDVSGTIPEISEPLNEDLPKIDVEAGEVPAPEGNESGGGCNAAGPFSLWGLMLIAIPLFRRHIKR
jgi:hypothetical protein